MASSSILSVSFFFCLCFIGARGSTSLCAVLLGKQYQFPSSWWWWWLWRGCHLETWGILAGLVVFVVGNCLGVILGESDAWGFG